MTEKDVARLEREVEGLQRRVARLEAKLPPVVQYPDFDKAPWGHRGPQFTEDPSRPFPRPPEPGSCEFVSRAEMAARRAGRPMVVTYSEAEAALADFDRPPPRTAEQFARMPPPRSDLSADFADGEAAGGLVYERHEFRGAEAEAVWRKVQGYPEPEPPGASEVGLVEPVAKRIAQVIHGVSDAFWPWPSDYSDTRLDADDVRKMARAAILAMREPTKAMRMEGCPWTDGSPDDAATAWRSMIDAALKSGLPAD